MANTIKSAARKRRSEISAHVELIPVFDETFNGDQLRNEIRDYWRAMYSECTESEDATKDVNQEGQMRHNVGLYVRVSTEEQALRHGGVDWRARSIAFRPLLDFKNVQETGWGKVVDTYCDEGISAKDTRRPAFQRMMRDIRAGRINLILVTDLSRLSRNIMDFCVLLDDLRRPMRSSFRSKSSSIRRQRRAR